MLDQPMFSEEERDLLVDLLLLEQRELPVEIHRASNSETRKGLHHRRDLVEGLLARLRPKVAV
jgi:hypothetical protein